MEVDVGGDNGSDGGGEGGSEPSGSSPPEDDEDEDGGVDEPAEELPASPGEPSSRTALFPSVSLLSEWWVLGQGCLEC